MTDREKIAKIVAYSDGNTDWEGVPENYSITCIKCKKHYLDIADQIIALGPDLLSKEMIAWLLRRLNGKDAVELMLMITTGKPLTNWTIPKHLHASVIAANLPKIEKDMEAKGKREGR